MGETRNDANDELQRLQSGISSLFQSVISERNKYKYEKEVSETSLDSLLNEVTVLRRENEELQSSKNGTKDSCEECIELRGKLSALDKRCKRLEGFLDMLRKFVNNVSQRDISLFEFSKQLILQLDELNKEEKLSKFNSTSRKENFDSNNSSFVLHKLERSCFDKSKKISSGHSNVSIVFQDTDDTDSEQSGDRRRTKNITESIFKRLNICSSAQRHSVTDKDNAQVVVDHSKSASSCEGTPEFYTPKKAERSEPFSRGDSSARNVLADNEESNRDYQMDGANRSPVLFVDQRHLNNKSPRGNSPASAFKRKTWEFPSLSPLKRSGSNVGWISPKMKKFRSPAKGSATRIAALRPTNAIDAEISVSGIRKLKQTQLNFDYYKNTVAGGCADGDKLNGQNSKDKKDNDSKLFGEDDLIMESPRSVQKHLDDLKKTLRKAETDSALERGELKENSDVDPEETFVSSLILKKADEESTRNDEREDADNFARSPEYNSVHYPARKEPDRANDSLYKDEPVRKKAERMKLPGQMCATCYKYYKAVLGEIRAEELQEILDQCSRHRDKHCNVTDTPPGYWKPYLTATEGASAEE